MTRSVLLGALCATLAAGCSDNHGGRVGITGTVKLKGQPIKDGTLVIFEPLDGQDTGVNTTVNEGTFDVPRQSGLKPGKYLVRVTVGDGITPENPIDPDAGPGPTGGRGNNFMAKDLVPKDWNVNSKQQVTVTSENPNKFDFDIP
ncbi:MAG TPA: hypothetical protein VM533_03130 [Fimbriiglobus sp.]|nr:hypothetical protein [Fimbriiglobus sp.]